MKANDCRDEERQVTTHHLAQLDLQPGKAELWVMASTARATWEIAAQLADIVALYRQPACTEADITFIQREANEALNGKTAVSIALERILTRCSLIPTALLPPKL